MYFSLPNNISSILKDAVCVSSGIKSNEYEEWKDIYRGSSGVFVVHMQPANMRARVMKVTDNYAIESAVVYADEHENEFSYWYYQDIMRQQLIIKQSIDI